MTNIDQEQVKEMIRNCLADKDVVIISVNWESRDATSDLCEMKVTFDIKESRSREAIQDAFDDAMSVVEC